MLNIDFVVTWVNGADKIWMNKKKKYDIQNKSKGMNSKMAYRDWGLFKYWFRGVEKFAPWVHKIYLVVDNQVPSWLDIKNPKIKIVNHRDYLPESALPLFNSNAIQSSLHKIPGLSEHFVYFNDDMYIVNRTVPEDFFKHGLPCDEAVISPIIAEKNGTDHFQVNNMEIINKYFSKKDIIKNSKLFSCKYGINNLRTLFGIPTRFMSGFLETHLPESFLKSTFEELWNLEFNTLMRTTNSRFRALSDTNDWLFRDWQLASGKFIPRNNRKFGKFTSVNTNEYKTLVKGNYKVLCINDSPDVINNKKISNELISSFETLFSKKSKYEL